MSFEINCALKFIYSLLNRPLENSDRIFVFKSQCCHS